eukprot:gene24068-32484_t
MNGNKSMGDAYVPHRRSKLNRYSTGEDVLQKYSINRRSNSSDDLRVEGFNNKSCIITGGSSGLGLETVKMMLLGGARRIYVCCRNTSGAAAALSLSTIADHRVVIVKLDLLSLRSIKECADEILERERDSPIDIVVCNAGTVQPKCLVNENGWEHQMATNYMGHFYLVNLLLPKMKAQLSSSRIVVVSSSKLAIILFARALALRLEETQVIAVALHPGRGVRSLIFKTFFADKSIPQGVATTIYACIAPEITRLSGSFFDNCARADDSLSEDAQDHSGLLREWLWRETRLQIMREILKMAMAESASLPPLPPLPSTSSSTATSASSTYSVTFILPESTDSDTTTADSSITDIDIENTMGDSNGHDSNKECGQCGVTSIVEEGCK